MVEYEDGHKLSLVVILITLSPRFLRGSLGKTHSRPEDGHRKPVADAPGWQRQLLRSQWTVNAKGFDQQEGVSASS